MYLYNNKNMPYASIISVIKVYGIAFINFLLAAISLEQSIELSVRVITAISAIILLPYTIRKLNEDFRLKRAERALKEVQLQQEQQKLFEMIENNRIKYAKQIKE